MTYRGISLQRAARAWRAEVGLAFTLLAVLGSAAPASAAIGGFEGGDGDQTAKSCATAADWECVPAAELLTAHDGTGAGDETFVDGSKEQDPRTWALSASRDVPSKADVLAVWTRVAGGRDRRTFLDVGFLRAAHGGDTYLGLELNQSRATWVNAKGTTVPCRTDGDVLVSYEVQGSAKIVLHRWEGAGTGPAVCPDGASGTWSKATGAGAPAIAEAAMNVTREVSNVLPLDPPEPSFEVGAFGEAALDLTGLADLVNHSGTCAYFRQLSVKTRSSSDISSSLQDWVGGVDVMARSCESPATPGSGGGGTGETPDVLAPATPTLLAPPAAAVTCGPEVTISGTGEAGSTVTVYEGPLAREFALVASDGTWSVTLPGVSDGSHRFSALATDAAGNTSGLSADVAVDVDGTAPAAPTLEAATQADGTVVLTGRAEPGSTVAVIEDGATVDSVTAGDDGAFETTLAASPGRHVYTATSTDACHTGAASAAVTVGSDPGADTVGDVGTGAGDGNGTTLPTGTTPDAPAVDGGASAGTTGTGTTAPAGSDAAAGTALGEAFPGSIDMAGGVLRSTACAARPFKAYVRMKGVRDVRFMLDGRTVKVVRRADALGQYVATVDPSGLSAGSHKLTARVTFRRAGRKAKTLDLRFRRCDQCLSRRSFPIRVKNLRGGERAVSAVIYVNGRRAKVVRGSRLRSRVVLSNLPKGTYTVRIVARTNRGRTSTEVRRYRTCVPSRTSR